MPKQHAIRNRLAKLLGSKSEADALLREIAQLESERYAA